MPPTSITAPVRCILYHSILATRLQQLSDISPRPVTAPTHLTRKHIRTLDACIQKMEGRGMTNPALFFFYARYISDPACTGFRSDSEIRTADHRARTTVGRWPAGGAPACVFVYSCHCAGVSGCAEFVAESTGNVKVYRERVS